MCQGQGLEGKGWRSQKKGLKNKEGKEEPWKRGKKEMNNKEGKEEPWKRGKAKPEKKDEGVANKVENDSPFSQVWPSLSSMVLPFPL